MKTSKAYKTSEKKQQPGLLVLEDGNFFIGQGLGFEGSSLGELCFNTSMTGYQEIITDPSYTGQIITFTFPHIGNVGSNIEDIESEKPQLSGIILRSLPSLPSNHRSELSLEKWLIINKIVGICGVDTRLITKIIRKSGPQNAIIINGLDGEKNIDQLIQKAQQHPKLENLDLAKKVSCMESYQWSQSLWINKNKYREQPKPEHKVIAIDYGIKFNILRSLTYYNCDVTVVPADTDFESIMELKPDGVFLSNGPGDPAATGKYAIPLIKKIIENKIPIFGICLGFQLLSIALGAKTEQMFQGHRGANHPVKDLRKGKVLVTSQNHGFAVSAKPIPSDIEITHISLFDNTIQGLRSKNGPFFGVQFHPEASPGPQESLSLFKDFTKMMKNHA